MQIRIIGAPMDLGADRRGVDIGPSAIRYAGLSYHLHRLGYTIHDIGNIAIPQPESQTEGNPQLKYLEPIVRASEELERVVSSALSEGEFPLILGGDHSIALGSISAAVHKYHSPGVIWIDAHPDFNTAETTPSGNIHGMILAALTGLGDSHLTAIVGPTVLNPARIAIVGARDIDVGERNLLRTHQVHVFTMSDIDRHGISDIMQQAIAAAGQNANSIHLSLDMDALDPREAPGAAASVIVKRTWQWR
jgi:arginase